MPGCRFAPHLLRRGPRPAWPLLPLLLLFAVTLAPAPARAGLDIHEFRGSISIGYAKLFATDAPGGSMSTEAAISYPVVPGLALGPSFAFQLLGTRTVEGEQGVSIGSLDYSMLEVGLLARWAPTNLWPLGLVSFGPELVSAKADLSSTGGGAEFEPLAQSEIGPGAALELTLIKSKPAPVRVGLQISGRWAFLPGEDWKVVATRMSFEF